MTAIETTAKNATGMPAALPNAAGIVMIAAHTAMNSTALRGTRLALTLLQCRDPGIAPSRLNAKAMRDALVRHAIPQNICPTVEMIRISFTHDVLSAFSRTAIELPPASVIAAGLD